LKEGRNSRFGGQVFLLRCNTATLTEAEKRQNG
jgi:hypothetical protein